jgi:Outer membrane protein beta-barrel domain
MQHRLLSALILTSLVVAAPSLSKAERLDHGTFEWSISGFGSRDSFEQDGVEDGDRTEFAVVTELGYFVNPVLELAVRTGGWHISEEPQGQAREKANSFILGARILANIPNDTRMTPYAFLGTGIQTFSGDEDIVGGETATFAPSIGLGTRYFMGDHVSFNIEFDFSKIKNYRGVKERTNDVITFSVGFSAFLRRQ